MAYPPAECCNRYHKQIKHQGTITRGVYIATISIAKHEGLEIYYNWVKKTLKWNGPECTKKELPKKNCFPPMPKKEGNSGLCHSPSG